MSADATVPRGRLYLCTKEGCSVKGERYRVLNHILKDHLKPGQVPYYCSFCGFKALTVKDLEHGKSHRQVHERCAAVLPSDMRVGYSAAVTVGDLTFYQRFVKQETREASQAHFLARRRPSILDQAIKEVGLCESDLEPQDRWEEARLSEATSRWGKGRWTASSFAEVKDEQLPVMFNLEEPPRKVKRKLNETGVPVRIPSSTVSVPPVDPREKEFGDTPVLELVGDVWERQQEVPVSSASVPPSADLARLEKRMEAMERELSETKAEVIRTRQELQTSNEEKKRMTDVLERLLHVIPPSGFANFVVKDKTGKQVDIVAVEQVPVMRTPEVAAVKPQQVPEEEEEVLDYEEF